MWVNKVKSCGLEDRNSITGRGGIFHFEITNTHNLLFTGIGGSSPRSKPSKALNWPFTFI